MSQRLLDQLRSYWKLDRPSLWLFPGRDPNKPLTKSSLGQIYTRAKQKAGIKKQGGIHTLRHCFGTHLLEAGEDLRTLQILMGHKNLQSTARYMQMTSRKLQATRSPLDLLGGVTKNPIRPQ
jgi:site-specific recombinase XerD